MKPMDFLDALNDLRDEDIAAAAPVGSIENTKASRKTGRRKARVVMLIAAAVLVIGALSATLFFALRDRGDDPPVTPGTTETTKTTQSTVSPSETPSHTDTPTSTTDPSTSVPQDEYYEYEGMTFKYVEESDSYALVGVSSARAARKMPGKVNGRPVTEIALAAGFTKIGSDSYFELYLSEYVSKFSFWMYNDIPSDRTVITVDENNPYFRVEGGCLIENSTGKLIKATRDFSYIPADVKEIGDRAFYSLKHLVCIVIPEGVQSIGSAAFGECVRLIEVCNLSSLKLTAGRPENGMVASYAKHICTSVDEIEFFAVGFYVFHKSDAGLYLIDYFGEETELTLPKYSDGQSYKINRSAFADNANIVSVTIPEWVTAIGADAFKNCASLAEISIPVSVVRIDSAFGSCPRLHNVYYGGGIEDWLKFDFDSPAANPCYNGANLYLAGEILHEAVVPAGTEYIKHNAFYGCRSLHSVSLPKGLTLIGTYAFANTGLTKITLPKSLAAVDPDAFTGCSQLVEVCNLSTLRVAADSNESGGVGYYAKNICRKESEYKQFAIGDFVFYPQDGETLLFAYIGADRDVVFPGSCQGEPYVINDNAFIGNPMIVKLTIPGAERIGNRAFAYCPELQSAVISGGGVTVGEEAFFTCKALKTLTLDEGVTAIESNAFAVCTTLVRVSLPESLTELASFAFFNCPSIVPNEDGVLQYLGNASNPYLVLYASKSKMIVSADIRPGTKLICSGAFMDCTSLKSVTIPESVRRIGGNAFASCKALTSIVLPAGLKAVEEGLFHSCTSLMRVSLPEGLERIDAFAFYGCRSLEDISLPDTLRSIGEGAFENCTALARIDLPSALTEIGVSAFNNCASLTRVVWPSGVSVIGEATFLGCESLESVVIPEGVEEIHDAAFGDCAPMTTIILPQSLKRLEIVAFYSCENLKTIYFRGDSEAWSMLDPIGQIGEAFGVDIVCGYTGS